MSATASAKAVTVRNILLATDFSPCSQRALLHAVAAARRFGSTLHLAYVVNPTPFSMVAPEGYLGSVEAANHAAQCGRAEAQALLQDVLRRTRCESVSSRIWVEVGRVGETLLSLIDRERIDLAVVGTRGRTGLNKLVLGSVAEEIFRQASCPVLTVGPCSWTSNPETVRLKQILFPTDLSENSARALPLALGNAAEFGATLTVLNVIETLGTEKAGDRPRLTAESQARMREMVCAQMPMPPNIEFQTEFGDVVDCVLKTAARLETDLIIAGLKPPTTYVDKLPWARAYKVVCNARCPVLTLRRTR